MLIADRDLNGVELIRRRVSAERRIEAGISRMRLESTFPRAGPGRCELCSGVTRTFPLTSGGAEKNMGYDLISHTIHVQDPAAPVKLVEASKNKLTRAEPIATA